MQKLQRNRLFSFLLALFILVPGLVLAGFMDSIQLSPTRVSVLNRQGAVLSQQDFWRLGGVNLNTADKEALQTLPGVGEVLAERILAHRQESGGFANMEELLEIKGIGPKTLERIRLRGYLE